MLVQSVDKHSAINVEDSDISRGSVRQKEKEKEKEKPAKEKESPKEKEKTKAKVREVQSVGPAKGLDIALLSVQ